MSRWVSLLALLLVAALVTVVTAQQPAPAPGGAPTAVKIQEGKVKSVDQVAKKVTLDDGSQFTVPAGVAIDWAKVKPGVGVAVHYEEQGGQKMVRRVEVGS